MKNENGDWLLTYISTKEAFLRIKNGKHKLNCLINSGL